MKVDMIIQDAQVFNAFTQSFERKTVAIKDGMFVECADVISYPAKKTIDAKGSYMIPGLVDIHMHIESSMTIPARFSNAVLPHGVTTVVADPHEIANVFGMEGIKAFISNATTLDIFYGIPSSVPSTNSHLETTGGCIGLAEVEQLLELSTIKCLGEVMNFQDVCEHEDSLIANILRLCKKKRPELPIEGHCPKVSGAKLASFIAHGVTADHTHQTPESVYEKICNGMFIELQRKSLSPQVIDVIKKHHLYEYIALVTDDVMADHLREGHLNEIIKQAVTCGMPIEKAIYCATFTPARRMHLEDRGAICPGRVADFFFVSNLEEFTITDVYKNGSLLSKHKDEVISSFPAHFYQSLQCAYAKPTDFQISLEGKKARCHIMAIEPHSTFTKHLIEELPILEGKLDYQGYALITVFERYGKSGQKAHGLVENAIREGAIATSWAHDHHNVMVLGTNEEDMLLAQHTLLDMQGGYVVVKNQRVLAKAQLEVGGIVSERPIEELGRDLQSVREAMRLLGYVHDNEIMSCSTLSLPVSPELKITDKGLLNTRTQEIVPFVEEII